MKTRISRLLRPLIFCLSLTGLFCNCAIVSGDGMQFCNSRSIKAVGLQQSATSKHGNCFVYVVNPDSIYVWRYETDRKGHTDLHITTLLKGQHTENIFIPYPDTSRWYLNPEQPGAKRLKYESDASQLRFHGRKTEIGLYVDCCLYENPDSISWSFARHTAEDFRKYILRRRNKDLHIFGELNK